MKNAFSVITLAVYLALCSFQQHTASNAVDAQRKRTTQILDYLESGLPDSIMPFITSSYKSRDTSILSKLRWISLEIQKVDSFAKVSNGLILIEDDKYIFCCRYSSSDTDYVEIDIHYLKNDEAALVCFFEFKDTKTLMQERKKRQAESSDEEPPAPDIVKPK